MMDWKRVLTAGLTVGIISGCSPMGEVSPSTLQSNGSLDSSLDLTPQTPDGPMDRDDLTICSELDFEGVSWSSNVAVAHRNAFALALNITGSFEGSHGWANLANNFDGQGLSLGLLNQNLGQGTLQPMWLEMRNAHRAAMQRQFSTANYNSLSAMLSKWEAASTTASLKISDYGYSELDDPDIIAIELGIDPLELQQISVALLARNQASVDWAKATVYNGSSFKSDWSTQLRALANSAEYRSIQVRKAEVLHNKALELMTAYGFRELRAYLFFFDIVVQNGGISSAVRNAYFTWAKSNTTESEASRLTRLLELRLGSVRPEYVNDVRARKMSIIKGEGTVHGKKRNYVQEYCASIDKML